jgi:hypothetical protein
MDKKDLGEKIYLSMLGVVYLEYCEFLLMYYSPRLALQYDSSYVKAKIDAFQSVGKSRSNQQKKRVKMGVLNRDGAELITFINGCFDEQKFQLLRQLRRALGETPEYVECETYLAEVVESEKEKIKKLVKKEEKILTEAKKNG